MSSLSLKGAGVGEVRRRGAQLPVVEGVVRGPVGLCVIPELLCWGGSELFSESLQG